MAKSFFKYFPPPAFLTMPAIGINITDEFVRVIEFKQTTKGLTLGKYKEYKIPKDVIENSEIKNKDVLVGLLVEVKKDFGYKFVRVALPEEKTYVFRTDLPHVPDEAVPSAIEFKIQENVPISPAEAVFDYSIISRATDRIDVSVTVVPQTLVAQYTEICNAAGLTPISFKVESQAIARAIIINGDMTTSLIINFGDRQTGFYIVSNGVVQFSSTLKLGGDSLTSLIERYFKVPYEKAVEMKRTKAFAKNSENTEFMYTIGNSLSIVKDEINKVQVYWRTYTTDKEKTAEKNIERIILCGEDVIFAGIDRYLSLNVGLPVEVARVWGNAFDVSHYIPELPMVDSLNYAAAIGLALGPRKKNV